MERENKKRIKAELSNEQNHLFSFVFPVDLQASTNFFNELLKRFKLLKLDIDKKKHALFAITKSRIVLLGTFLLLLSAATFMFYLQPNFESFHEVRTGSSIGKFFFGLTLAVIVFKFSFFLYSLYLYNAYKAIPSVDDDSLPTCTVIVPAYNEGELVWHTLISLANSDYPIEKLELLAIDDGSKDDTWQWMLRAKASLGDRLTIFQQPKNMGKRQALHRGFLLGKGEIFITVDSDSIVKKDTLRNLVSPLVLHPNCGAVAGNVKVLNNSNALIPKMLNVSFVFSFEFVRSVESRFGSVLCTPGALAAYKKEAVFNCLPQWMEQKFMGKKSDIGEDRAMTNMILKQGYKVLFQKNAEVLTNVPETYKGLYKMFIRWGRSNVRENLCMFSYVFQDFRNDSKFGIRLLFADQMIKMIMTYPAILFLIYFIISQPLLFITATLFSILVLSSVQVIFYAKKYSVKESFWAYSYGLLFAFGLFWITPYAIATAGKSGWLTREISN